MSQKTEEMQSETSALKVMQKLSSYSNKCEFPSQIKSPHPFRVRKTVSTLKQRGRIKFKAFPLPFQDIEIQNLQARTTIQFTSRSRMIQSQFLKLCSQGSGTEFNKQPMNYN